MRVRSNPTPQGASIATSWKGIDSSTWVASTPGALSWENQRKMVDVVTPGFQVKRNKGEVIISPMTKWVTTGQFQSTGEFETRGRVNAKGKRAGYRQASMFAPLYLPDSGISNLAWNVNPFGSLLSRVEGLAITDAFADVGTADMSVLVALAELPETLVFLYSPVRKMEQFVKRAKKWREYRDRLVQSYERRRKNWESLPARVRAKRPPPEPPKITPFKVGKIEATDISGYWLAVRYGLMPLIYEFQDLQKALKNEMRPPRMTARGKASDSAQEIVKEYDVQTGNDNDAGQYNSRITHRLNVDVTSRAGVLYEPLISVSARWGTDLHRVPAALYELIPLSFVADWFWNGASAYDALTAELRARKILGSWVVSKATYTYEVSRLKTGTGPNSQFSGSPGGTFYREEGELTVRRKTSVADVGVYMRLSLNAKRVADGLALIHQFVASGRRR